MKKTLVAILALAAVAACNKAEVVETNPGEAITFGDAFVDNATKATDPSYGTKDISSFNVYGTVNGGQEDVLIYNAATVTKDGADYGKAWTCGVTQYWIEGADYTFTALVDVADNEVVKNDVGMPTSFSYTAADQKDVLCQTVTAEGQAKGKNSIVSFTFTHLLAKAYFTVTNGTPDSKYKYTISNVKVTNAYAKGVYTLGASTPWAGSDLGTVDFSDIANVVYGTPATSATEVLLIPGAEVGVSFDVTLSIDGTEISKYSYSKEKVATLAANSIYNFNITLQPNDPIQFTVTASPNWGAETDVNL